MFQEIFDEVIELAIHHHMVAGRLLITDSTHIQANVNKNRFTTQVMTETPQAFLSELEKAINEDRELHGKKATSPCKRGDDREDA